MGASFELLRRLGAGATSVVWLARRADWKTPVALKIARSRELAPLLAQEASRLLLVDSPALTELLEAGKLLGGLRCAPGAEPPDACIGSGSPYVALEWAEGDPADSIARDTRRLADEQRDRFTLTVARDVAEALADLHRAGSAHGDVKPANVVVDASDAPSGGWRARLVDLGLSSAADERTPQGATLRYLAPEVLEAAGEGDARARDLWALGLTLAELYGPRIAESDQPAKVAATYQFSEPVADIVRALLSRAPAARPSAQWVWRRANVALGTLAAPGDRIARRERAVRRSYLAVRRAELLSAAQHRTADVQVSGLPGEWLKSAIRQARQVAALRGQLLERTPLPLRELSTLGRSRWLVKLVGSAAARWPLFGDSDAEVATRLLELSQTQAPESITLAALWRNGRANVLPSDDPVDVGLQLGAGRTDAPLLDAAERLVIAGAPASLGLALGRALRRSGELGRALTVLGRVPTVEALVEAAETARRARDFDRALRLIEQAAPADRNELSAQAAATAARIHLDQGRPQQALSLLNETAASAATEEVLALTLLGRGRHQAAREHAARARALATSEEERARAEALGGMLSHAAGEAEVACRAGRNAVEHAVRAGAVLEEASYLAGLSAAAADVGALQEALESAKRAILLFEHLGRHREAARAALARTDVYRQAGAVEETREAAYDALARAREAGDRQCQGYVHMLLADVLEGQDREGIEHAQRALGLLQESSRDDRLRAHARVLMRGGEVALAQLDQDARDPSIPITARLEWWQARARCAADQGDDDGAGVVLEELRSLSAVPAPITVRGPALSAGAELAARLGDGEAARQLAHLSAEAARRIIEQAPAELRPKIAALRWVAAIQSPREASFTPEQLNDVDTLVRALARRDRLRPLLDQVLDALVLWTGVERGLLLLRAPGGRLVPRAARNLARSDLYGPQLELSHTLAERALTQREPVVAIDAAGELPEVHASVHALQLRSVLAVPLIARGETLGVVYLDDRERRGAFGPRELAWVRLVSTLASVAIADARDQLLLRRAARRAERAEQGLARELAQREAQLDAAERELARTRGTRETRFAYSSIIGDSSAIREMLRLVDRVTVADVPVLIVGESGSGKELVARAVHDNGPRNNRAFVTENCGAIPEGLLESTLFGHVRGAFTGAARPRAGLFEIADGGTLFLDEIAEMSLGMQTKLLRVIEDGQVRPVGSERGRRVQVRVIGATHRNLEERVKKGAFREDLFYRLNVITIRLPPLRDREGDVELLVRHFITKHAPDRKVHLGHAAMAALKAYSWPGNVRQLENEMRRALVLADKTIELEHLSSDVVSPTTSAPGNRNGLNVRGRVDALERELVEQALNRTAGNQTRAAELLGLSRFGLQKMMRRLNISSQSRTRSLRDQSA